MGFIPALTGGLSASTSPSTEPAQLRQFFRAVRRFTETLAAPLSAEDCVIQSMPDVSPTRWHLAHTTWFFETFVLAEALDYYQTFDPAYEYLFNSYYNAVGEQFPRGRRGLLSRPTVEEVFDYRHAVDAQVEQLLANVLTDDGDEPGVMQNLPPNLRDVIELGLHHEQQHQELILTDIKHVLSCNPLFPSYHPHEIFLRRDTAPPGDLAWRFFEGGVCWIGREGEGFAYDNESPRHRVFLEPFEMASYLVTNQQYIEFMEDGGYQRPELWLSAGWTLVQEEGWMAPLYWTRRDGSWRRFTLAGLQPVEADAPLCHVSYFEADAFARWSGARLPTEAEWEIAAEQAAAAGRFADDGVFDPAPARDGKDNHPTNLAQMFGDVWEWTSSSYAPYPGYWPNAGALGEYNGKFMCNQYVLRGGSCATPQSHIRPTYRNFFPPQARWQFSGIRLARSV